MSPELSPSRLQVNEKNVFLSCLAKSSLTEYSYLCYCISEAQAPLHLLLGAMIRAKHQRCKDKKYIYIFYLFFSWINLLGLPLQNATDWVA